MAEVSSGVCRGSCSCLVGLGHLTIPRISLTPPTALQMLTLLHLCSNYSVCQATDPSNLLHATRIPVMKNKVHPATAFA